jgi:hypothetical protein
MQAPAATKVLSNHDSKLQLWDVNHREKSPETQNLGCFGGQDTGNFSNRTDVQNEVSGLSLVGNQRKLDKAAYFSEKFLRTSDNARLGEQKITLKGKTQSGNENSKQHTGRMTLGYKGLHKRPPRLGEREHKVNEKWSTFSFIEVLGDDRSIQAINTCSQTKAKKPSCVSLKTVKNTDEFELAVALLDDVPMDIMLCFCLEFNLDLCIAIRERETEIGVEFSCWICENSLIPFTLCQGKVVVIRQKIIRGCRGWRNTSLPSDNNANKR